MTLKHQQTFEAVLDEMSSVRADKCGQYGETRYEHPEPDFNRWMCFSDVHRKYIRAEHQTKQRAPSAALRETYLDLANYAAMAVQLIDMGRFDEPKN